MFYVGAVGWIGKLSQKVSVWSMAQEYEFQYKVATSKKKSSRPRADASGGERVWLRHTALGVRQRTGEWARCLLNGAGLARAESPVVVLLGVV